MARVGNINLTRATWETGTLAVDGRVHRFGRRCCPTFVTMRTTVSNVFLSSTPDRSIIPDESLYGSYGSSDCNSRYNDLIDLIFDSDYLPS